MCRTPELRAAGLIIYRNVSQQYQYLLMQTSYGHHHWTPPKGHVDPGETDLETALRETKEEAGLNSEDFEIQELFKRELKYTANSKPKTVVYWLAKLINPLTNVALSDEHQDYKWLPLVEAKEIVVYQDLQNLLQECEEFLKHN